MVKSISHKALDAALAYIADHADTLALCEGPPASAAEALTPVDEGGRALACAAMRPGPGNGDFCIVPGLASGRRLVIGDQEEVEVIASGRADHLALVASATGELLIVVPLGEPFELLEGGAVTVRGFSEEIADPV